MDIAFMIQKKQKKTEQFDQVEAQSGGTRIQPLALLVSLVAVYLSWNCNSAEGRGMWEKVIYAFFAFVFGGLYLTYYLLFRENWCRLAFLQRV